jgi:hypothetical protein
MICLRSLFLLNVCLILTISDVIAITAGVEEMPLSNSTNRRNYGITVTSAMGKMLLQNTRI